MMTETTKINEASEFMFYAAAARKACKNTLTIEAISAGYDLACMGCTDDEIVEAQGVADTSMSPEDILIGLEEGDLVMVEDEDTPIEAMVIVTPTIRRPVDKTRSSELGELTPITELTEDAIQALEAIYDRAIRTTSKEKLDAQHEAVWNLQHPDWHKV